MVGVSCRTLFEHEEHVESEAVIVLAFFVQGVQPWQALFCPLQKSFVFRVFFELFGRFQSQTGFQRLRESCPVQLMPILAVS